MQQLLGWSVQIQLCRRITAFIILTPPCEDLLIKVRTFKVKTIPKLLALLVKVNDISVVWVVTTANTLIIFIVRAETPVVRHE